MTRLRFCDLQFPTVLVLLLCIYTPELWAQTPVVRCGTEVSQNKSWKYCLHQYPNSSNKVLYYLHGIMGSEKDWKDHELERGIVRRWMARGERPPIVVSISFGPVWLMTEKNPNKNSGLFEIVSELVIPKIEIKILRFKPAENWLMGVSMGGFNSSQLYFKKKNFFSRAAIICGAMAETSPYANKIGFDSYVGETGAKPFLVWLSQTVTRSYISNLSDWIKNSPLDLGKKYFSPRSTPLYVANGLNDEFGFHIGNIKFAETAYERGAFVQSDFYPGRSHCYVDSEPIADFFMQKI